MIRTRFAPSPTGYLHIGGARTALFSWAYARRHGGKFVLRIEDTDLERSTAQSTQAILDGMAWLGLDYDEGPFYQMQRLARYHEVADQLLRSGDAYYCYCTRKSWMKCASSARQGSSQVRRTLARLDQNTAGRCETRGAPEEPQDGTVAFNDLVKGQIAVATASWTISCCCGATGCRLITSAW